MTEEELREFVQRQHDMLTNMQLWRSKAWKKEEQEKVTKLSIEDLL